MLECMLLAAVGDQQETKFQKHRTLNYRYWSMHDTKHIHQLKWFVCLLPWLWAEGGLASIKARVPRVAFSHWLKLQNSREQGGEYVAFGLLAACQRFEQAPSMFHYL